MVWTSLRNRPAGFGGGLLLTGGQAANDGKAGAGPEQCVAPDGAFGR